MEGADSVSVESGMQAQLHVAFLHCTLCLPVYLGI